jgi:anti-sigma B factor antagonist
MALTITTTIAEDLAATVAAEGEVDVSCASDLRAAINAVLDEGATSLVIDLAQVPYIDSTGIGVLVGAAHRGAEAGISVRVANPQRNVRRVLDMLGVVNELGIDE